MPTTPRRSSHGGRRTGKAYVPYRGDQMAVGKRTGVTIREVQRQSDGFENFEEVMNQNDPRTPPIVKKKAKKTPVRKNEPEVPDDDGEMSMDLDDSPLHYIQATTKVASASRRVGSSSRPVARTPPIDFDEVPSPRPQGNRSTRTPRPSRLSQAIASGSFFDDDPELDGAPEVEMNGSDALDDFAGQNGMDDFGEDSPPHRSFQEMDRDDEDDELGQNHDDILPPDLSRISVKAKGKSRQMDEAIEDDIGQGLDNIGPQSDEEPAPRKVTKKKKKDVQPRKIVKILPQKENRDAPPGVRRSSRTSMPPLDWWRNEKVVYGRIGDEHILVPQIREIQRIKAETPPPLGGKKPSRKRKRAPTAEVEVIQSLNPEEGWDDHTPTSVRILTWPDGTVSDERQIAFTAKMVNPTKAANNDWLYQRLFGDGQFMAAGQLVIPAGTRKQTKRTRDNTFVFYVIEGAVNLKIHESSLVLCTGAAFMVPRGNSYFIENICERDAKLFFSQARIEQTPQQQQQLRKSSGRSSSAGQTVVDGSDGAPQGLKRAASSRI